jgi:hypothetical protein
MKFNFQLFKKLHLWHHDVFFGVFHCFQNKIGPFQGPPMFFLHVSQQPLFTNIYIIQNILTLVLAMSPWCPWCHLTLYPKPSTSTSWCPLLSKKKKFMLNLVPLVFLTCFLILMSNYLLSFGCSLLEFLYFCSSPSFIILGVVQVCFCC